ncbi:L-aspartate oxidase [Virgibacillus sp. DJP39]|uniref:L-aspartate oxidase n=1 Tax=Virgibacillus sp. DJP39 TaxID=3409790 RepID=UPI003BB74396
MAFYDIIIVGSGIAALTAADKLAMDRNVIIFTKSNKTASNSFQAQGGIAAAVDADDRWEDHFQDTLVAGCQHNDTENLQTLIQSGPGQLAELVKSGLEFDLNADGTWNLGREGGHLKRRILHAQGDGTGKALVTFMLEKVKNKVTIIENEAVVDLIVENNQCVGVTTKNCNGDVMNQIADSTILATGGCGELFLYTSNDRTVTGDGVAMAYRAGAELADMEFIQFHPTLLYNGIRTLGLISEAVRGEGARLIDQDGQFIMEGVHELKDLAPRDIVARTIFTKINKGSRVYLDITKVTNFSSRFPTIYQLCVKNGIDVERGLLPVIPGAHFMIGGVRAGRDGRTSMDGLYAVGEVACTGVHGANRIASNSLLEGIVFGNMTAEAILTREREAAIRKSYSVKKGNQLIKLPTKQSIKQRMMHHVGVVRNEADLLAMKDWLETFDFFQVNLTNLSFSEIEIVNMLTTAWLITTSALMRRESRGTHYRLDYPLLNGRETREEIIRIQLEYEEIK